MNKILLNDLLNINDDEIDKVKVKFNQTNYENTNPMEEYKKDPEIVNDRWLFWRSKQRYFNVGQIAICLLRLSYDTWLLTTIKEVERELNVTNGINYEGREIEKYSCYFGRVILKHHKTYQSQGRYFKEIQDELEILEILPSVFDGESFPGYDNVRLSFQQLETIITRKKSDWIGALQNQKAVYLITDKSNGKLYVGSATSDNGMLLDRWTSYIKNGHGGNKSLIALIKEKGFDYIKNNFQYSILENYNAKTDDNVILQREQWWKETLKSKDFGYNCN